MKQEIPSIGSVIKRVRQAKELTQAELAARSGVRQATISQIEARPNDPNFVTILRLSVALGVRLIDLIPKQRQVEWARAYDQNRRRMMARGKWDESLEPERWWEIAARQEKKFPIQ